jgi:hypothetical protein
MEGGGASTSAFISTHQCVHMYRYLCKQIKIAMISPPIWVKHFHLPEENPEPLSQLLPRPSSFEPKVKRNQ